MGIWLNRYVKYGEEIEVDEKEWEKLKKYDNFKKVKENTDRRINDKTR